MSEENISLGLLSTPNSSPFLWFKSQAVQPHVNYPCTTRSLRNDGLSFTNLTARFTATPLVTEDEKLLETAVETL